MGRKLLKLCVSLLVVVAPLAYSQELTTVAKVTVPFAFEISSGQHFEPGDYDVFTTGLGTIVIRSDVAAGQAMIQVEASDGGEPVARGTAIFMHYGDKYFLRSVSLPGTTTRLIFGRSREERHWQQVAAVRTPSYVALAVLQFPR
jgi:hypothetical protein